MKTLTGLVMSAGLPSGLDTCWSAAGRASCAKSAAVMNTVGICFRVVMFLFFVSLFLLVFFVRGQSPFVD
jgi:hypothetical protein